MRSPSAGRRVRPWYIFLALPVKNGPLPTKLKFRENTVQQHIVFLAESPLRCNKDIELLNFEIKYRHFSTAFQFHTKQWLKNPQVMVKDNPWTVKKASIQECQQESSVRAVE